MLLGYGLQTYAAHREDEAAAVRWKVCNNGRWCACAGEVRAVSDFLDRKRGEKNGRAISDMDRGLRLLTKYSEMKMGG